MRALVAGGAGFIGSHLVERLVAEGHAVDVVDDLSCGSLGNLAAARRLGGQLRIHSMAVQAPEFAELVALREPDVVFHLPLLPPGRCRPVSAGAELQGMVAALQSAAATGATKVVVALPAGALYGQVAAREVPVKDGHDFAPVGLSGVLARTAVDLAHLYRERHGVTFTVLALTTVYGPRQRPDGGVVAAFRQAAEQGRPATIRGDGRQSRDLLFIDDAVDALARAATRGEGLVINVGCGTPTVIRDLWQLIGDGAPADHVADDPDEIGRFAVAITRARIHLQWEPWTTLAEGLGVLQVGAP